MAGPPTDPLERLSRRVGIMGGLIAAMVAITGLITSYSERANARLASFRSAVASEEEFWRDRYRDYQDVFDADAQPDNEEERTARLFALTVLSDRQVPHFGEFWEDTWFGDREELRNAASRSLCEMRSKLRDALQSKRTGGAAAAEEIRTQSFDNDDSTLSRKAVQAVDTCDKLLPQQVEAVAEKAAEEAKEAKAAQAGADAKPTAGAPKAVSAPTAPSAPIGHPALGVSYETRVLGTGPETGWDVDVFWCAAPENTTEASNYQTALRHALTLSGYANAKRNLGPGVFLGRVRLRVLPLSRQNRLYAMPGDPAFIRAESSDRAEADAGTYLQRALGGAGVVRILPGGKRTQWYLSVFVCGSASAPSTTPAATTAR